MKKRSLPDCPAAPQHWADPVIFAVFSDGQTIPVELTPVSDEWLARCAPQTPRQVRMASTCIKERCRHWDAKQPGAEGDGACILAQRVLASFTPDASTFFDQAAAAAPDLAPALIPGEASRLQPCAIRGSCWWFLQHGRAVCRPCMRTPTDLGEPPQDEAAEKDVEFF